MRLATVAKGYSLPLTLDTPTTATVLLKKDAVNGLSTLFSLCNTIAAYLFWCICFGSENIGAGEARRRRTARNPPSKIASHANVL